jgi:hypothetical protein
MACKLRQRKDDIPKRAKEKSWECEECGALLFSVRKPVCRLVVLAEMRARRASAEADVELLDLDHKVMP